MKTLLQSFGKILAGIIFLVLLIAPSSLNAQQIIMTEQGDTLVTITPDQVRTINVVFSDHRLLTEKSQLQSERIKLMENRIEKADTIILKYSLLTDEMKKEMTMRELAYKNSIKKEKTKYFLIGGATGIVIGVLVTLLICK